MSFRKLTILALLLSLFVTSCAASEEVQDTSSEPSYSWQAEFYTVESLGIDISSVSAKSDGEYVYFTEHTANRSESNQKFTYYYRWKIGESEPEKLDITGTISSRHYNRAILQPDGFGNYYVVSAGCIAKLDSDGNELYFEYAQLPTFYTTAVDEEGHLFVAGDVSMVHTIYMFNTDCTFAYELENIGYYVTNAPDGSVFTAPYLWSGSIYSLTYGSTDIEAVRSISSCTVFSAYNNSSLLFSWDDPMYMYDMETGETVELFLWSNLGINYTDVKSLCVLSDGSIVAFLSDDLRGTAYSAVRIYLSQESKTVITIGTFSSSTALSDTVAEFNRKSLGYTVEIRQYYNSVTDSTVGGTGYQDALTRFHLDIVSGNCPDIINISYDDLKTYVSQGLFEDLSEYLEESGIDIFDGVKDAYTFNGILAAITPQFCVRTIVGRASDLNGLESWNTDELMELIGSDTSFFNISADSMLNLLLKQNLESFVNYEEYTCSFQNEEFYKILRFCNEYRDITILGSSGFGKSAYIGTIADREASFYEITLLTPYDYIMFQQLMGSENIVFIGFPTDSGSGALLEDVNGSYAISSISEHKNEAWEFIEYMITSISTEESTRARGFPVVNQLREELFSNAMAEPWKESENEGSKPQRRYVENYARKSLSAFYYVPFPEEIQPIIELINTAEAPKANSSTIFDIISENAADYFDGEKTAEEVAKQIQSRVMLYLGEIK